MNILMGMVVLPLLMFVGITATVIGFANNYIVLGLIGLMLALFGFVGWVKSCTGDWDFENNNFTS